MRLTHIYIPGCEDHSHLHSGCEAHSHQHSECEAHSYTLTDHNCYEQTLNSSNALGGCLSAVMAPIAPAVHVVVVGVVSRLGKNEV